MASLRGKSEVLTEAATRADEREKERSNMAEATWKPSHSKKHGKLDAASTNALPDSAFAFSKKRKEPMTDASHVRNAIARFDQVEEVNDEEREEAFANIKKAAKHYGVEMQETSWHELGSHPHMHKKAS
jgi:hypothetical protein